MDKLNHTEVINLLIQLAVMLSFARIMAELARKFNQPAVVGEILAGIILGPTILGTFTPDLFDMLFPTTGASAVVLDGFIQVAVVLLLFIAGLEVDLHIVFQQGKQALYVSMMSLIIPFAAGFVVTWFFPELFHYANEGQLLVFAMFIGTVMAITALPVVARVLMDLEVFKTRMGMLIIASAMIIDLLGWIIFTVILNMMGNASESLSLGKTLWLSIGFTILMLTIGKGLINRALPWINKRLAWPGGLLSLSLALCFLAAAFTEYIGIHSIFGAFILGVALGDSKHLSERAKEIIHQFINNIFAPLFFVSIGLGINFIESFNIQTVLVLLIIAFIFKVLGATLGARMGGLSKYESFAVGFGMNTHGTLEVILGAIALQAGLITDQVFVAILVMVVATIVASAPLMKYCLKFNKNETI
ncbi:Putative Na/H antiporter [Fulvivirga imtechensis AK7]|uniref:Putative Na/H antiporter n=1 Tax=Fulvivirga imtechensis AK7 TaxID=1237149 RepID=L8JU87_9BACT|nr:cation:proton antiporter [Fulvivirga imtechensis]ELR72576.1 Putative Na/H antiporter [Fulvivirga imtechensis AK7]